LASKTEVVARERRWMTKAGLAGIAGGVLGLAGFILLRSALSGDTNFEGLEEAHEHISTVWIAGVATLIGTALLAIPLLLLFNAARARSTRMRGQLIGIVVLEPVLVAIAGILLSAGTQEASNNYLDGKSKSTLSAKEANAECKEDESDEGAEQFGEEFKASGGKTSFEVCEAQKHEEDRASESIKDASLISLAQFFGIAGALALVVALLYTCLNAMRVGLLTRFWGSLGMAVGVAALIGFSPIMLLWFIYLGLLLGGWLPSGRPPAWEEGEAVPWMTPGQKAAEDLEPEAGPAEAGPDVGEGPDVGKPVEAPEPPELGNGDGSGGEPRKRKKRD
jgi:hypothetical protein